MKKRLYRSKTEKVFGGVCGGIADYFDIDPVFVRLISLLFFFIGAYGILVYIIAWIIIPKEPKLNGTIDCNYQPEIKNEEDIKS